MEYYRSLQKLIRRHPNRFLFIVFVATWLIASLIFFFRFPNNFIFPNFFAEDGQHFVKNIMDKGFLGGLFTAFNGYFIFGIYILTGLGFLVNAIFFGNEFVNLPGSLAIVSYGFLGLCAALPVLLLRKYMSLSYGLALALLIALLPFPSFDYGTFGVIGNLKFAFNFIAVLLILYRITLPKDSLKIIAVDAILLIGAYTTAGVYLILPFIILSDGLQIYRKKVFKNLKKLFTRQNISLWSGLALLILCSLQILFVVINGVPKFPGYLDEPYKWASTIEVFVARSYLFPYVSALYHHLTDIIVIALLAASIVIAWRFGNKQHRKIYIIGFISILTTSIVFVINRTGTAFYYDHYATSGFDNFFYAQNFIALMLGILILSDIAKNTAWVRNYYIPLIAILALAACSIRANITYAPNDFMQYKIGTIGQQAKSLCSDPSKQSLTFSVYPFEFLTMTEPRSIICTPSLEKSQSLIQDLGTNTKEATSININPGNGVFTQTFTANRNNLSALSIYLGTYYKPVLNQYDLQLMDETCRTVIRQMPMPRYVRDNALRMVEFKPITDSKDKTYCFTIRPTTMAAQPLAVRLSADNAYAGGQLQINGFDSPKDVVFFLLYK